MKKFKWLGVVCFAIVLTLCALVGCAKNKTVTVGKYYAEGSTESYIEILEDNKAMFVNVDLSGAQEVHDANGENIDVIELMSSPVPYDVGTGDHIMFVYHEYYALWAIYDYNNHTITFDGEIYIYQA